MKDVAFYDSFKTGEMLSRLGSDTQAVQDGLTTNVAMFVKSACIAVGCVFILCTYSVPIGFITLAIVMPQIIATRISAAYLDAFSVRVQKATGIMTNVGAESLSNIRTVKAHGDEEMTGLRFALENQNCFTYGRVKGYFWSIYFVA